ncbi:HAD family hydrolase [Winogradskyella aurantiaca]|uniref:HAD family hydrolase n=1 Tax=Winogradskyella aurantiaca TaxID=2219558 RepID=UPI000E1CA7A5|nr:HAD family hydrolase [Winogradskyella aurantiaca]
MKSHNIILIIFIAVFGTACDKVKTSTSNGPVTISVDSEDPLPSWNDGATKSAIVDYIKLVTTDGIDSFIPIEDRIATFDNDGNLWAEQPAYFQLFFALDQIKAQADDHPEWQEQEPFKSVLNDDMDGVMKSGMHGLMEIIMNSHAGTTSQEYRSAVSQWLSTAKHPRFGVGYNELIYQPMLELLDFLRANQFKVFIVSGGGIDFMRVWATEAYGIPSDQIIGSSIKAEFSYSDEKAEIIKIPELNFIDDKEGKPVGIYQHIGKIPVFASGNSDGDLQMLQYCDSNSYPSFQLYLQHTDAEREWAYDRDSHIGKLDKGLDEARAKGWTVIDMKNDWKTIFPFQLEQ